MGHGYTAGEGADTQAMCGICGIIRFDLGVVDRDSIGRMNDIAAHRGLDVDQPRNLAKSVTVE